MKKSLSLLVVVLVVLSMMMLTACSTQKAQVISLLEIDSDFAGHRSITVKYPLSADVEGLEEKLLSAYPLKDSDKSTFEYEGVEQDGYTYVMDIKFDSHEEYLSQVKELVSRQVHSYVSQPQTVLTKGTRMSEDFDVSELISWITDVSKNNENTASVDYDYSVNTVSINGSVYNTSSTIDVMEVSGHEINSIAIETTNLKDGNYDRTITFSIPNKTYDELSGSIKEYFGANTSPLAQYCDWTSQGSRWEYKVIFKSLDITQLSECTAMLLDTDDNTIMYGDKYNSSTPLSEGLMFEEEFDTFSFIGKGKDSVELTYKYALPTKTTHGDGTVYYDSKWNTVGSWQDSIYSVTFDSDTVGIRIPDGIEYAINGIDMTLQVVDNDKFVRTTDFLYSKTQGMDGMLYAKEFFEKKGATVVTSEDDDNLICSVVIEGSHTEITDKLTQCFGSGNLMDYTVKNSALALNKKTALTEHVNLSNMLNSTNANRPITYTVYSSCDEKIKDLSCNGDNIKVKKNTDTLPLVEVEGGQGIVTYNGRIANTLNIIIFIVLMSLIPCAFLIIVVLRFLKKRGVKIKKPQFNLPKKAEAATDEADKALMDEIDKDISEKIEADRIQSLTKEAKAQELEKLYQMVNGKSDDDAQTNVKEEQDI